jgi:hypothetical protein
MKTHYEGGKIVVTLYCYLGVLCLNFNNIIIMKNFHKFLHIMVGESPKKSNAKKTTFFISYDVIEYICARNIFVLVY